MSLIDSPYSNWGSVLEPLLYTGLEPMEIYCFLDFFFRFLTCGASKHFFFYYYLQNIAHFRIKKWIFQTIFNQNYNFFKVLRELIESIWNFGQNSPCVMIISTVVSQTLSLLENVKCFYKNDPSWRRTYSSLVKNMSFCENTFLPKDSHWWILSQSD